MEGTGIIKGKIEEQRITFIKQMPVETILLPNGKLRKTKGKHKDIVYHGQLCEGAQSYSGTWKIKLGIAWFGIIPVPVGRNRETWEMKKENNPPTS